MSLSSRIPELVSEPINNEAIPRMLPDGSYFDRFNEICNIARHKFSDSLQELLPPINSQEQEVTISPELPRPSLDSLISIIARRLSQSSFDLDTKKIVDDFSYYASIPPSFSPSSRPGRNALSYAKSIHSEIKNFSGNSDILLKRTMLTQVFRDYALLFNSLCAMLEENDSAQDYFVMDMPRQYTVIGMQDLVVAAFIMTQDKKRIEAMISHLGTSLISSFMALEQEEFIWNNRHLFVSGIVGESIVHNRKDGTSNVSFLPSLSYEEFYECYFVNMYELGKQEVALEQFSLLSSGEQEQAFFAIDSFVRKNAKGSEIPLFLMAMLPYFPRVRKECLSRILSSDYSENSLF